MGYIYTATFPNAARSGKSVLARLGIYPARLENVHVLPPGEPARPIHRELKRRLELLREERRELALSPGDDEQFARWTKVRDRGARLSRVLCCCLLGEIPTSRRHTGEVIHL